MGIFCTGSCYLLNRRNQSLHSLLCKLKYTTFHVDNVKDKNRLNSSKKLWSQTASVKSAFIHNDLTKNQFQHNLTRSTSVHNDLARSLQLLDNILELKESRATALVIENKLTSLTFYYDNFTKENKEKFICELAVKFSANHESVHKLSQKVAETDPKSDMMIKLEGKLREVLTPKYAQLFSHLGRMEGGVKFLVDLRYDILVLLSSLDVKSPHQLAIQQLNSTLKDLLSLWFSVGFLHLEKVNWSSPCTLLEKVSKYEAVHPVNNWIDIKQRVGPYRRCFVYTHHSMPGEPLVVLHVALTKDIEHSVENIISPKLPGNEDSFQNYSVKEEPQNVKAFIFYSISATQKGLQGIELGNYMIKRAAKELHSEYPQAMKFSTLSPIPTFRQWLLEKIRAAEKGEDTLRLKDWEETLNLINPGNQIEAWTKIRSMIFENSWIKDDNLIKAFKAPLLAACSRYLYLEKKRGYAFDSVANFHLRNGATMWRLNWMADKSPQGLTNSCGLMVNYRYYLDAADTNSIKYIQDRTFIASEEIIQIATGRTI